MRRIAYLGGGNMGRAMVARLIAAGSDVTVYNRTPEKLRDLQAAGAKLAATPREAAAGAAIVFASVTDDDASRAVWTGQDGALSGALAERALLVEHSTLSHDWVMELSGAVRARGMRYVDCPVAGRPDAAAAGQLVVFAGAEKADLEEIRPLIVPISKEIFHFGAAGSGTAFKLIYNLMGATQIAALAEGLAAAEAAGIDIVTAAQALSTGATGSPHVVRHAVFMAEGKHEEPPAFTGRGRLKDSSYGVALAEKFGQEPTLGRAATAVYRRMVDAGMAAAADSRVLDVVRKRR